MTGFVRYFVIKLIKLCREVVLNMHFAIYVAVHPLFDTFWPNFADTIMISKRVQWLTKRYDGVPIGVISWSSCRM